MQVCTAHCQDAEQSWDFCEISCRVTDQFDDLICGIDVESSNKPMNYYRNGFSIDDCGDN